MTPEEKKLYNKTYYEINKTKIKEASILYYNQNKETILINVSKYQKEHKNSINKVKNIYRKNRRDTDNLYNLTHSIRSLISISFKEKGFKKQSKTSQILGCTFLEFKTYLESKFESWMTWENKGLYNGTPNYGWDVDHITPLSSAITEEELLKLNNFNNLQPLCSHINRNIKRNIIS